MFQRAQIIASTLLVTILLSACATTPAVNALPGLAQTLAVRTLVAQQGISYFTTPTPSVQPTIPVIFNEPEYSVSDDQNIPLPSQSPVPSLTPFGKSAGSYLESELCKNKAEFIGDVTISDLSVLKPGQRFTKVWQLKNTGTCPWTPKYAIVFTYGDRMGGISPKPLGIQVLPGDKIDISVDLIAPKNSDIYQGNWMLQDEQGEIFGTGSGKRDFFYVAIMVGNRGGLGGIGPIFGGGCGGGG